MIRHLVATALAAALAAPAAAQQPAPADDPLGRYLFPPELVMSNQRALGLQDPQRDTIMNTVRYSQAVLAEMQMRMAGEMERLTELLGASTVDQAAALSQLDRVLAHEHQIKRQHIAMLIKIRNTLTAEQRGVLVGIRWGQPGAMPLRRN